MLKNHRQTLALLLITTVSIRQPLKARAAGRIPAGLQEYEMWFGSITPLTTNVDRSYERNLGGPSGSCVDASKNSTDFKPISPSKPQNLAAVAIFCP